MRSQQWSRSVLFVTSVSQLVRWPCDSRKRCKKLMQVTTGVFKIRGLMSGILRNKKIQSVSNVLRVCWVKKWSWLGTWIPGSWSCEKMKTTAMSFRIRQFVQLLVQFWSGYDSGIPKWLTCIMTIRRDDKRAEGLLERMTKGLDSIVQSFRESLHPRIVSWLLCQWKCLRSIFIVV